MAADGLITLRSSFGPEETMSRFEAEVRARAMTIFSHIDHTAGAAAVGLPLRPTDLLIFGAAKVGTPLMQSAQTIGIDLPLKALVWQDEAGNTFLSYNDPAFVADRHGIGDCHRSDVARAEEDGSNVDNGSLRSAGAVARRAPVLESPGQYRIAAI